MTVLWEMINEIITFLLILQIYHINILIIKENK
mgnify:CR=1 FL=1|jgi:hypothetical protein